MVGEARRGRCLIGRQMNGVEMIASYRRYAGGKHLRRREAIQH